MSLEMVAVVITLVAVYLTTRQIVWCWPLGMVSVTLYAVVFFEARLYADMGLQGLYFALAAYGWWAWLYGGEDHGELDVSLTSLKTKLVLLVLATGSGLVLGRALSQLTDAALPYMDSTLTTFSIAAQWMQARKLLENWLVWIGVDVFYVGMFLYKELYLTAALYAVFLLLAGMGLVQWRRSWRHTRATEDLPAVPEAAA
jgi:nicotinamide mononucleotide transporter